MAEEHLVLIPGLLCSRRLFEAQVVALSDAVSVTVADHTRHDSMIAIAQSILDAAPERFALAGLSMGGYIAQEVMRLDARRVTRLCLLDTRARTDTPEEAENRHRLLELCARDGVVEVQRRLMPRLVWTERIGEEPLTSEILRMAEDVGASGFRRQMAAIMTRPDFRPVLGEVTCPTTIIVGREDMLTPLEMSEEMAGLVPHARLCVLPDCGHMSTMERPEEINAAMRQWLSA
jgi:pimeloyl-ACP methyl ester carboxylesterase